MATRINRNKKIQASAAAQANRRNDRIAEITAANIAQTQAQTQDIGDRLKLDEQRRRDAVNEGMKTRMHQRSMQGSQQMHDKMSQSSRQMHESSMQSKRIKAAKEEGVLDRESRTLEGMLDRRAKINEIREQGNITTRNARIQDSGATARSQAEIAARTGIEDKKLAEDRRQYDTDRRDMYLNPDSAYGESGGQKEGYSLSGEVQLANQDMAGMTETQKLKYIKLLSPEAQKMYEQDVNQMMLNRRKQYNYSNER